MLLPAALLAVASALIVGGLALVSVPAALIVAGLLAAGAGVLLFDTDDLRRKGTRRGTAP